MATGTHDLNDLKQIRDKTAVQYGLEDIQNIVMNELAAHNAQVVEMLGLYASPTTSRQEADGTGNILQGVMEPVDDYSRVRTQKDSRPAGLGFPMQAKGYAIGFTARFLREAPVAEVATRILGAQDADRRDALKGIKTALFNPVNYTFYDDLVDDIALNVKALYNGDGSVPPNGPNGESFDGTHNHFAGVTALTTGALDALILNVAEHNANADVRLHINVAQEAAVRGLTGFVPAVDPRIIMPNTATYAATPLALGNRGNRLIGYYNQAEVWIKPWVPAAYIAAVDVNAADRVLRMRVPENAADQGLRQVAENVAFPLQAQYWEVRRGFGVKSRGAAAILYIGGSTYTAPTIA